MSCVKIYPKDQEKILVKKNTFSTPKCGNYIPLKKTEDQEKILVKKDLVRLKECKCGLY